MLFLKHSYQVNLKQNNTLLQWNNKINLLFNGLRYNTRAHCLYFCSPCGARKNTTQLAKYLCVLYVKPSNKMYLYTLNYK